MKVLHLIVNIFELLKFSVFKHKEILLLNFIQLLNLLKFKKSRFQKCIFFYVLSKACSQIVSKRKDILWRWRLLFLVVVSHLVSCHYVFKKQVINKLFLSIKIIIYVLDSINNISNSFYQHLKVVFIKVVQTCFLCRATHYF